MRPRPKKGRGFSFNSEFSNEGVDDATYNCLSIKESDRAGRRRGVDAATLARQRTVEWIT
jgi:hypothetical protein